MDIREIVNLYFKKIKKWLRKMGLYNNKMKRIKPFIIKKIKL